MRSHSVTIAVRFALTGLVGLLVGGQSAGTDWTVYLRRVGPLAIGIPISEARRIISDPSAYLAQALRQSSEVGREPDDSPCAYLVTARIPEQIGLMFQRERLARVDVWRAGIRTARGAQVGDPEARVLELYGPRVKVTQHHYPPVGAHHIIFTPVDTADRDYEMLFETDGARVTRFRAGLRAAVAQVEGCA
jgi:hypothetical protein